MPVVRNKKRGGVKYNGTSSYNHDNNLVRVFYQLKAARNVTTYSINSLCEQNLVTECKTYADKEFLCYVVSSIEWALQWFVDRGALRFRRGRRSQLRHDVLNGRRVDLDNSTARVWINESHFVDSSHTGLILPSYFPHDFVSRVSGIRG